MGDLRAHGRQRSKARPGAHAPRVPPRRRQPIIVTSSTINLAASFIFRVVRLLGQQDHLERNHQGLGNALIDARASPANDNAPVERRQRLGGVLSFYERRAG